MKFKTTGVLTLISGMIINNYSDKEESDEIIKFLTEENVSQFTYIHGQRIKFCALEIIKQYPILHSIYLLSNCSKANFSQKDFDTVVNATINILPEYLEIKKLT